MMDSSTSPPKRSKSYRAILAAAKELMYRHGIRRVTVDELCSEAGVSKMTFYRNFENKTDVAVKIMEDMFKEGMDSYRSIMKSDTAFPEKMKQLIEFKRREVHRVGDELIKDIYQSEDETLRAVMEKYRQSSMAEYIEDLKTAQKEGWVRPGIKSELILLMLDTLHEKMQDPRVMAMYDHVEDMATELNNFFFYGILIQPNE